MADVRVQRDAESAAFFDGTERGEFLIVLDTESGQYLDPTADCSASPERYQRVPARGTGHVVSWAVTHNRGADGAVHRRAVGIVQLDEGPWWWTELKNVDLDGDLSHLPVTVRFERLGNDGTGEVLPVFVPVQAPTDSEVG